MPDLKLPLSCEQFEAHVSDYIDGALSVGDRATMDAHGAQCASCLALLVEVRAIVGNAAVLPDLSPSRDLWSGIAERLDAPVVSINSTKVMTATRPRTVSFRVFAAAAALLVSVSSGLTYLVTRGSTAATSTPSTVATLPLESTASSSVAATDTTTNATTNATTHAPTNSATIAETASASATANGNAATTSNGVQPALVASGSSTAAVGELTTGQRATTRYASRRENSAEVAYEREIISMRRIVNERLGDLDSVTVVEIERNLRIIDKAINDSRRALQNDPRSRFLSKQLDRALENKLDIMRRVALL